MILCGSGNYRMTSVLDDFPSLTSQKSRDCFRRQGYLFGRALSLCLHPNSFGTTCSQFYFHVRTRWTLNCDNPKRIHPGHDESLILAEVLPEMKDSFSQNQNSHFQNSHQIFPGFGSYREPNIQGFKFNYLFFKDSNAIKNTNLYPQSLTWSNPSLVVAKMSSQILSLLGT